MPESVEESAVDPSKTPTDVFRAILQANRQLNLLTQRAFAPSDVYMEVTLAIGYASRLLSQFPAATRLPDAPAFERRMRPADVYGRLLRCFERIRQIAQASGLKTLNLQIAEQGAGQIAPADVYDIASLLVSELAYLHSHLPDAASPRQVFHPGLKTPSHVYQRVGILEAQLAQLSQLVDADSSWLQAGMANSAK